MPCEPVKLSNGASAIVCSRGGQARRCACGRTADRLCVVPIGGGRGGRVRTCNRPVCTVCSVAVGDDDVCQVHPVPDEALALPSRYSRSAGLNA